MTPQHVTIELVREELQDRVPGDNSIDCDQFFSDEEILHAMERAAAAYNSMAPIGVMVVHPKCMPTTTNVFLDATISRLLGTAIHKLSRNQMDWSTGGVSVSLEKPRMQAFQQLKQELEQSWRAAAKEMKAQANIQQAWGAF